MYGGLPIQYNPHSTSERDAVVLQGVREPYSHVRYRSYPSPCVWGGTVGEDGEIMWRYIGKYYGS